MHHAWWNPRIDSIWSIHSQLISCYISSPGNHQEHRIMNRNLRLPLFVSAGAVNFNYKFNHGHISLSVKTKYRRNLFVSFLLFVCADAVFYFCFLYSKISTTIRQYFSSDSRFAIAFIFISLVCLLICVKATAGKWKCEKCGTELI